MAQDHLFVKPNNMVAETLIHSRLQFHGAGMIPAPERRMVSSHFSTVNVKLKTTARKR